MYSCPGASLSLHPGLVYCALSGLGFLAARTFMENIDIYPFDANTLSNIKVSTSYLTPTL